MTNQHYILIMKEDHSITEKIHQLLQGAGYNILSVTSDEQGLALMHKHKPDVLLLDLTKPDTKSWNLFHAVKGDKTLAGIPVIDIGTRVPEGGRIIFDDYLPPVPDLDRVFRSIQALASKSRNMIAGSCA